MEPLQITISVLVSLLLMFVSYIVGQWQTRREYKREFKQDMKDLRSTMERHYSDYAADMRNVHGRLSRLEGRVLNGKH